MPTSIRSVINANLTSTVSCRSNTSTRSFPNVPCRRIGSSSVNCSMKTTEAGLHVAALEEDFYKQKSKLHWLHVGDQNNKVFHNAVKVREMQNSIREIRCPDGFVVSSQDDIKKEAERFFSEFLQHKPEDFEGISVDNLRDLVDFRCSEEETSFLQQPVTAEEVRATLFAMPSNKSPGPDGYPCEFFKLAWPILGQDFTIAVQSFFIKGFLPKGVNSTILALIPKKTTAEVMKDYRPIACCNVLYKVVSKIIANRLKELLPRMILPNQSAFVQGRLLMENVLLATEIVKDYHANSVSPRCAMKIDISKAFDSVQWSFVLNSLKAMGFPDMFIHWVRLCITSASFSVQVNGELAGYFQSARGLRQGCSVSPYLFVICMNVLSLMINMAAVEKKFGFHPRCQSLLLTHLCFADDLLVFVEGSQASIEGIIHVFDVFARCSGLKISLEKSTLYMAGISDPTRNAIMSNFPFEAGDFPVRYLGLRLLTKGMVKQDYQPLIEKIRGRISSWTTRFLSFAGRLQLIQSVLMSIINFWSAAYRLPSACIEEIERMCSAFLWSGPDLNPRKSKVSWEEVCKSRAAGGLGLRRLKDINIVCGLKLIWRMLTTNSLWTQWVKMYTLRSHNFWDIASTSTLGSWMWKKTLKLRDLAKTFYKKKLGNGNETLFWHENWSDAGILFDQLGPRGFIDLGISVNSSVGDVMSSHRRRRHRQMALNDIEDIIDTCRQHLKPSVTDTALWRRSSGFFPVFSSSETWLLLQGEHVTRDWAQGVWFPHSTPKFSFITWLAMLDRLSTCDRMKNWCPAIDVTCCLCKVAPESRNHMFFECSFTGQIWSQLTKGILCAKFTSDWSGIQHLLTCKTLDRTSLFLTRYAFQAAVYYIWGERNKRRHGKEPTPLNQLSRSIDKTVRNRLSLLRNSEDKNFQEILMHWFGTRV